METLELSVPDIECDGCANAIKNALGRIDGIVDVVVDVPGKQVTVNFSAPATGEAISTALDKAGFPASPGE